MLAMGEHPWTIFHVDFRPSSSHHSLLSQALHHIQTHLVLSSILSDTSHLSSTDTSKMHFSRLMTIASTIACSAAHATLQPSSTLEGIDSITELDGNDIPHALVERNPQARCGRGFGKCSDDGCCSTAGWSFTLAQRRLG